MLSLQKPPRKPAARHPFCSPLWDDNHDDFKKIDSTLPQDHHARWLVTVVSHLDLTSFRRSYAGYGSLAYPVELLLVFVLFMYSKGHLSPAQWATQARYDDQSKWLLRGLLPSRSRLYVFRDRVEPFLDGWHKQLLNWAVVEGVTKASSGSLDGSFVASLASRHQLMSVRRVDRRLLLLRLLVWLEHDNSDLARRLEDLPEMLLSTTVLWLELLKQGVVMPQLLEMLLCLLALVELLSPEATPATPLCLPVWVPHSVAGRKRVLKRHEDAQQRLASRLAPYQHKKKLSKKDEEAVKRLKVSLTDPEAALGWDKVGTYRPLYNVPLVQATDAPLTLAWDVLPRNNDDGLLKPMMEKTKEQIGHYLAKALVDGAFVSVGEVAWCEKEGIAVYAPPSKAEVDKGQRKKAKSAKVQKDKAEAAVAEKYGKGAFRYDSEEKVYYCPQGKRLEEAFRTTEKRSNGLELPVIVHRASGNDCCGCAEQKNCTSNAKKGRVVKRYEGEEALERLQKRMAEPDSKKEYKKRCQSVELGYADIKEHRGLRVFRCFGRQRARAQAGLVILASNGLKIMAALLRRQDDKPASSPQEKPPG
jgi:transposase